MHGYVHGGGGDSFGADRTTFSKPLNLNSRPALVPKTGVEPASRKALRPKRSVVTVSPLGHEKTPVWWYQHQHRGLSKFTKRSR